MACVAKLTLLGVMLILSEVAEGRAEGVDKVEKSSYREEEVSLLQAKQIVKRAERSRDPLQISSYVLKRFSRKGMVGGPDDDEVAKLKKEEKESKAADEKIIDGLKEKLETVHDGSGSGEDTHVDAHAEDSNAEEGKAEESNAKQKVAEETMRKEAGPPEADADAGKTDPDPDAEAAAAEAKPQTAAASGGGSNKELPWQVKADKGSSKPTDEKNVKFGRHEEAALSEGGKNDGQKEAENDTTAKEDHHDEKAAEIKEDHHDEKAAKFQQGSGGEAEVPAPAPAPAAPAARAPAAAEAQTGAEPEGYERRGRYTNYAVYDGEASHDEEGKHLSCEEDEGALCQEATAVQAVPGAPSMSQEQIAAIEAAGMAQEAAVEAQEAMAVQEFEAPAEGLQGMAEVRSLEPGATVAWAQAAQATAAEAGAAQAKAAMEAQARGASLLSLSISGEPAPAETQMARTDDMWKTDENAAKETANTDKKDAKANDKVVAAEDIENTQMSKDDEPTTQTLAQASADPGAQATSILPKASPVVKDLFTKAETKLAEAKGKWSSTEAEAAEGKKKGA